jgi:hypothetical protein
LGDVNDIFLELAADEELRDSLIVFGLYTIDNQMIAKYMLSP